MASLFFMEKLYTHVACKDVQISFSFLKFLNIWKLLKMHFKIKEVYTSRPKAALPDITHTS
jgi:hypothetical protein